MSNGDHSRGRAWRPWVMLFLPPVTLLAVTTAYATYLVRTAGTPADTVGSRIGDAIPWLLGANHLFLFGLLMIFMRADGLRMADIGWRLKQPGVHGLIKEILIGLGAGALIYLLHQYGFTALTAWLREITGASDFRSAGTDPLGPDLIPALLAGILLGGVVEEHIYRGYVLTRLQRQMPTVLAVIVMLAGFSLLHFGLGWSGMLVAALSGLLITLLFLQRASLPAPIVAHATVNALVLLL